MCEVREVGEGAGSGVGAAARLGDELGREGEREQRAPRHELGADVVQVATG